MSRNVIEVENLSKQYRLGKIGTGALAHDINRWWHTVRGKEDPYLKVGEVNDRTKAGNSAYVWSLRDIGFDIQQGDSVGIIGRNGAGKSTLLKILSRVTSPTTGSVKIKGRVASLLEVGTGFHPDLSGRENIFLNGAILGMRKQEVKRKFDEIVDFAGVERYIDTPVKRYSSGMYVRLAFGVAAHLESEILIVDEVLAVGDAEFQKKCMGKMNDVSKGEGRTVLFVSHNMGSIRRLCTKGIYLQNGTLNSTGDIEDVLDLYIKGDNSKTDRLVKFNGNTSKEINLLEVSIYAVGKPDNATLDVTDRLKVRIRYRVNEDIGGSNISFTLNKNAEVLIRSWDIDEDKQLFVSRKKGEYVTELDLPNFLMPGTYSINVACGRPGVGPIEFYEDCLTFELENLLTDGAHQSMTRGGIIRANIGWETNLVNS